MIMPKVKEKKGNIVTISSLDSKPTKVKSEFGQDAAPSLQKLDQLIFQSLINEGKHIKVINARRPSLSYNEKELRDAAHSEVAITFGTLLELESTDKKRKFESEEKEKQSRDRNKEHARFTRLRKKVYVSKLEDRLKEIAATTDVEEVERRVAGEKLLQMISRRKEQTKQFLCLRAANSPIRADWASLLDENVVLTLPITPYRSFPRSDIVNSNRVVRGVDGVMADTASLALMAECIGQGSSLWRHAIKRSATCKVEYTSADSDMVCTGNLVMSRYTMRIPHCDSVGGPPGSSCVQHGMLQCTFNPVTERIQAVEMVFDVMNFMQQLQLCGGMGAESSIVPNTLDSCNSLFLYSREPHAIVSAVAPYPVINFNDVWRSAVGQLQGESQVSEPIAATPLLQALRVYDFQRELILKLASSCCSGVPGSAVFLSHDFAGTVSTHSSIVRAVHPSASPPLVFYIKMLPLTSQSDEVSHLLVTLVQVPLSALEGVAAADRARLLTLNPAAAAAAVVATATVPV